MKLIITLTESPYAIVSSGISPVEKLPERCAQCFTELPDDARHCIECGKLVANTGKTIRLELE